MTANLTAPQNVFVPRIGPDVEICLLLSKAVAAAEISDWTTLQRAALAISESARLHQLDGAANRNGVVDPDLI